MIIVTAIIIYVILTLTVTGFLVALTNQRDYFNQKEQETKRRCKELYRRVTNA